MFSIFLFLYFLQCMVVSIFLIKIIYIGVISPFDSFKIFLKRYFFYFVFSFVPALGLLITFFLVDETNNCSGIYKKGVPFVYLTDLLKDFFQEDFSNSEFTFEIPNLYKINIANSFEKFTPRFHSELEFKTLHFIRFLEKHKKDEKLKMVLDHNSTHLKNLHDFLSENLYSAKPDEQLILLNETKITIYEFMNTIQTSFEKIKNTEPTNDNYNHALLEQELKVIRKKIDHNNSLT